jgi:hypothetical protein
MSFIVQKAFSAQFAPMRGLISSTGRAFALFALLAVPQTAAAREAEPSQNENCAESKRVTVVRSLTEAAPIRKKDKARSRRVLM